MGRTTVDRDATIIYWSGSSVTLNFEGTELKAVMKDEHSRNYFNIIIDNKVIKRLRPDSVQQTYTLAANLGKGKHTVHIYKLTEGTMGKTWFYGFELSTGSKVLNPPPVPKKRIEFYGNSITSGYSLEDTMGDSGAAQYYNNYLSYASLTARHYNAAYHCISKSGIGVMVSWFPVIMPELYDRTDPDDPNKKWDFGKYRPDVVVIDLCQNDSWLVNKPNHAQFKARFGTTPPDEQAIVQSYSSFVQKIRSKYPTAYIICTLGSMDATKEGSPWPGYILKATKQLKDKKVLTHFFAYNRTSAHPKAKEQAAMAKSLIAFIDKNVQW